MIKPQSHILPTLPKPKKPQPLPDIRKKAPEYKHPLVLIFNRDINIGLATRRRVAQVCKACSEVTSFNRVTLFNRLVEHEPNAVKLEMVYSGILSGPTTRLHYGSQELVFKQSFISFIKRYAEKHSEVMILLIRSYIPSWKFEDLEMFRDKCPFKEILDGLTPYLMKRYIALDKGGMAKSVIFCKEMLKRGVAERKEWSVEVLKLLFDKNPKLREDKELKKLSRICRKTMPAASVERELIPKSSRIQITILTPHGTGVKRTSPRMTASRTSRRRILSSSDSVSISPLKLSQGRSRRNSFTQALTPRRLTRGRTVSISSSESEESPRSPKYTDMIKRLLKSEDPRDLGVGIERLIEGNVSDEGIIMSYVYTQLVAIKSLGRDRLKHLLWICQNYPKDWGLKAVALSFFDEGLRSLRMDFLMMYLKAKERVSLGDECWESICRILTGEANRKGKIEGLDKYISIVILIGESKWIGMKDSVKLKIWSVGVKVFDRYKTDLSTEQTTKMKELFPSLKEKDESKESWTIVCRDLRRDLEMCKTKDEMNSCIVRLIEIKRDSWSKLKGHEKLNVKSIAIQAIDTFSKEISREKMKEMESLFNDKEAKSLKRKNRVKRWSMQLTKTDK